MREEPKPFSQGMDAFDRCLQDLLAMARGKRQFTIESVFLDNGSTPLQLTAPFSGLGGHGLTSLLAK